MLNFDIFYYVKLKEQVSSCNIFIVQFVAICIRWIYVGTDPVTAFKAGLDVFFKYQISYKC